MNEFAGSFDKVFATIEMKAPIDVGEILRTTIGQAHTAYAAAAENIDSYGDAIDLAFSKQLALARELRFHILEHTHANMIAALGVAQKLASSSSVYDALKTQAEFVELQSSRMFEQISATLSLSIKIGSEALAPWIGDSVGL